MEAYDTAVLSYALATAASKLKPGLLGIAPNIRPEDVSLTPPSRIGNEDVLFRMLVSMEQSLLNRIPVHLPQILEMCTLKQVDAQVVVLMDGLHHDLRQICKSNPGMQYFLVLTDSDDTKVCGLLKKDSVMKLLSDLYQKFSMVDTANFIRSYMA